MLQACSLGRNFKDKARHRSPRAYSFQLKKRVGVLAQVRC